MNIPRLGPRDADSHKGTYGRVLIVGGSRGMTGAVVLAGTAACRSGAGLVTLAVPDRCLETVASFDPNYMTVPLANDQQGKIAAAATSQLSQLAQSASSIGVGPGMSRGGDITTVVAELYRGYDGPMVVDADGLNALASLDDLPAAPGPRILTPHIGEFRRLFGADLSVQECREQAPELAQRHGLIIVLKGHRTLVTNGPAVYENDSGNPGMATGGAGDVLTGVITALLSQGELSPFDAAKLGVYVHGLAGDLARDAFGEVSMVAESIRDGLSAAFQRCT